MGPNGSGKTSFIQALKTLHYSLKAKERIGSNRISYTDVLKNLIQLEPETIFRRWLNERGIIKVAPSSVISVKINDSIYEIEIKREGFIEIKEGLTSPWDHIVSLTTDRRITIDAIHQGLEKPKITIIQKNIEIETHYKIDKQLFIIKNLNLKIPLDQAPSGFIDEPFFNIIMSFVRKNREKSIIALIDQIEGFLNPMAQINRIHDLVRSFKENKHATFIISTHSPIVLASFQRLLRKGELNVDDISIIEFNYDKGTCTAERLTIDEDFNIISSRGALTFTKAIFETLF